MDRRLGTPEILVVIGGCVFIVMLFVSAVFEADIRWLHFFQAWMYVAAIALTLRGNRWGYFIGVSAAGLSVEELQTVAAHSFYTNKPVVVAEAGELGNPDALIVRAFTQSGYISFLTVGGKENRAWPIRKGLTAWEAAGTIHTDMQKGFIRAEIIGYDEFIHAGGEAQAKRAGKQRLETKQYLMQDYDLANFRFNK